MDLLLDPWIDVYTVDGPATMGVRDVLLNRGDIVDVISDDPLEDAAILRLLFAAVLVADGDLPRWLHETRDRWRLFDTDAPFWQNPQLRPHLGERTALPAMHLSYRYAANGATLLDHHHNESGLRLTPAAAARALVMRQAFSVGGVQPYPEKIFGVKAGHLAVATNRPFAWIDAGNLADTLEVNRRPGPVGTFHHSWSGTVGTSPGPGGQADALTWQARSILLVPDADGLVAQVSIAEGVRYGRLETNPVLIPHTTFTKKKATDPYTARDVHIDRPAWHQLLTAYADPDAPGVLAGDLARGLPDQASLRLAGLASLKSHVDGPVTGHIPIPQISRHEAAELDAAVTVARKQLTSNLIAASEIVTPSAGGSTGWWKHLHPARTQFDLAIAPAVTAAVAGAITIAEARERLATHVAHFAQQAASMISATSPAAAVAATTPRRRGNTR